MAPGPCQLPRVLPCGVLVPASAKATEMFGQPAPRQSSPCRREQCRCPCQASQTVCPFALQQTHFCGQHQGTGAFNWASFTSPLAQPWYSDGIPWLWASYRQWSEQSYHLHGFPICPNSCDLGWDSYSDPFQLFKSRAQTRRAVFSMLIFHAEQNYSLFLKPLSEFSHLFSFTFSNRLWSHVCAAGRVWSWLTSARVHRPSTATRSV